MTQEMLDRAIALAEILNPAEMPADTMMRALSAIAALAQADALTRIANHLDLLAETGTGYGGNPQETLRVFALQ